MWRFLKKLEIKLPYDPAIPLLGIHTEETIRERDTCTPVFIAALFIISLLFNKLSRLVIAFLPKSKRLLISWLQSPSAVILETKKIESVAVSPSICFEVMGPDAMIFVF